MAKIVKAGIAKADLSEILEYVALDSHENAVSLINELDEVLKHLADYPDMGRKRGELSAKLMGFPFRNYVIYYRKLSNRQGIEVARLLHGRRDVEAELEG